ncbi:MAG: O-antigen ligase protein [Actinomycetia bacterium]|nr:O-antigen ligase protein [Actinomycetes bacterium]
MTTTTLYGQTLPRRPLGQIDAVTILSIFIVTLMVLPARYVVGPLGAAGTPAGIMAVLCLFWYVSALFTPKTSPVRGRQPLRSVILLFFGAILGTYAVAMSRALPGIELNGADRGVILVMGWVGIALLAADGIPRLDRLEAIRRRLVAGGTFMGVLGFVQFFSGFDVARYLAVPGLTANGSYTSVLHRDDFNRPMATSTHPIEFGVILAMLLPLAVHGVIHAEPGMRGRRWMQVSVILLTLPMTVSRSAILGLAIAGAVMLPVWPARWRFWSIIVLGVVTVVVHAAVPGLVGTVTGLVTSIGTDSSTVARTDDYTAVAHAVSQRTWFGQGFGTYMPQTYRILDNQYLGALVETGILGTIALVIVLMSGWFLARSARRASTDPAIRHLAQCFAASSAVVIFSYGTFDAFGFPMVANLTFLMLGCCGALWRLTREQSGEQHQVESIHE